jgi:hypothetical protein
MSPPCPTCSHGNIAIVESVDGRYLNGSRVHVNAPLMLRNKQWNKFLAVSNGDVMLLTGGNGDKVQLRINGDLNFQ